MLAALPHLLERKGAVVQVSSTSGRTATAAKSGVTAFAESLRQEVTERGVRVVVVVPGFVSTELTSHITNPAIQAMAKTVAESMRTLQPEDIAAAVPYAVTQPGHVAVNERDPDPPRPPGPLTPPHRPAPAPVAHRVDRSTGECLRTSPAPPA
ncbi:SDR family NAD(P)-dependent oxidoreductase [Actinacidiphila sp. bgisy160]|uniref:SDR family NAD(P)-dependent oxidoreductase n=1 Tax=Actinacidiphila sp. bgisy160 TaxID=3413796 RepID=UPI003D764744